MALLNTHPDYKAFEGKPGLGEYPASRYEEFLCYVREKHEGTFWEARPRDVSQFYRANFPVELGGPAPQDLLARP